MTVNGIRVPGWAVAAVLAAAGLIGVGVGVGRSAEAQDQRDKTVDYRLCRIERALGIEVWQSCVNPEREKR